MANAFSISKPNVGERPSNGVLLSLSVPEDGDYAIFAKLNLNNNASGVKTENCQLKAGEHDSSGVFDPTAVHQDVNIIRLAENGEENLDMAAVALPLFQES